MTIEQLNGDPSPFPSSGEMDFDLWKAGAVDDGFARHIEGAGNERVCTIHGVASRDADRDAMARRLEMIGDLYEELRKLADKARVAGIDTSQADAALSDFVSPKPFPHTEEG